MFKNTKGLILREVRYKEADRILTILTESDGKITAKARGALRKTSRTGAATQQLTYSELTLFGNRGTWTVNEAVIAEPFQGLRERIEDFALGSYFAECLEAFSVEDEPEPELLQLGLNSLYALSRSLYPARQIKAAFELRLMCIAGFRPQVEACPVCGKPEPEEPVLAPESGGVCCRACKKEGRSYRLGKSSLPALRYVVSAPARQLFSFRVDDEGLYELSRAAEAYVLDHAERRFPTLDYYKQFT